MNPITAIEKKGYIYQCTNIESLKAFSEKEQLVVYVGFDCTAQSLHIGNLLQIMLLRLMQKNGVKIIALIGGGTTKVGDPTGKEKMRPILAAQDIERNTNGIKTSLSKFLDTSDSKVIFINNEQWLGKMKYLDVLRDYGKYISISKMLSMDSIKSRLSRQQNLTFLEFNYSLLQAMDFYHLHSNYNCHLQIGGSDQWGNIISGVDLIHKISGSQVYGLTTPLITKASGEKMGKSVSGAIWLNEDMCSAYDYFQYWRNIEDADVEKMATLYAEYSDIEIEELKHMEVNDAKKSLAFKLTNLCHGKEKADLALKTSISIFENKDIDSSQIEKYYLKDNEEFLYSIITEMQLASSKSEARRLIKAGAVKMNDIKMDNEYIKISNEDKMPLYITIGKKKHFIIDRTNE